MKHLVFLGIMAICIAGINLRGQTTEQIDYSSLKALSHTENNDINIPSNQNELIKMTNETDIQAALIEEYEYETAGIKIIKYFGIPAMAGMSAALACLIAIMND